MIRSDHSITSFLRLKHLPRALAAVGLCGMVSAAHASIVYLPPCFSCTLNSTPLAGDEWVVQGNFVSVGVDGLINEGTLTNNADYFTNSFSFQTKGKLNNNQWMYNFGTMLVAGSAQAELNNSGTFWNQGTLQVYSRFNNLAGKLINQGQFVVDGSIINKGGATFINNATLLVRGGPLTNELGGLVENAGAWSSLTGSTLYNLGATNNRGTISAVSVFNQGRFTNFAGAVLNSGPGIIKNQAGGMLINRGTINVADSHFDLDAGSDYDFTGGTLNNNMLGHLNLRRNFTFGEAKAGVVNLTAGGTLYNYATLRVAQGFTQMAGGSISNASGGVIDIAGTLRSMDLFNQAGARLTNSGTLDVLDVLVNQGAFTNKGLVQISSGQLINQSGATLDNLGRITFGRGSLLNRGTLNNGGPNATNASLELDGPPSAWDFTGGTLNNRANGTLLLRSTQLALGEAKSGTVNLGVGGKVLIDSGASMTNLAGHTQVNNGQIMAATGALLLNNGVLVNHGKLWGGQITNNGTILGNGSIEIADGGAAIAGSTTQKEVIVTRGALRLQAGGSLHVNTLSVSNVSGHVLHDGGATVNVKNSLDNAGAYTFTGSGGTVNGNVTNYEEGLFQVTNSQAIFHGQFRSLGRYRSTGSFNSFGDLVVEDQGWIAASTSNFLITGDFLNHSTKASSWDTLQANLQLFGSGLHSVALAGADLGATRTGYTNNFAWAALALGSGSRYQLIDGNATAGGALYVGLFELQDGLSQLRNINSNYNIYYDALLAGNAYLGGQAYAFGNGSGHLIGITGAAGGLSPLSAGAAVAVPEPQEGALVMAGMGVLWLLRKRKGCQRGAAH